MKKILLTAFVIFAFSTPFFCPHAASGGMLLDRVVATVNGEVITWSELMSTVTSEGQMFLQDLTEEQKEKRLKELERPFLNNLIDTKLQIQEAKRLGIGTSNAEIEQAIGDIRKKYNLTDDALMKSLEAEGLTMQDYRQGLADQIMVTKAVNTAVKSNIVISDEEIDEFYSKNREKFTREEKVSIRQILFITPLEGGDRSSIEQRAQEVLGRIRAGEDFAALAQEYSEGPSAEFGGDLGFVSRGSAVKEVESTAFAMQAGEVSDPFWSSAGLHIIKVEDRQEGRSEEKVREEIKETLFQKAFEEKYYQWRASLREKAYVEIKL